MGLKVFGHVTNVGRKQERQAMVKAISDKHNGRIDVLVANAACSTHFGDQLEISEKAYDKMMDLNVKSVFFLIKECKDQLIKSK